jgi:hypothetical protein
MNKDDIRKIAIITPFGLFEFLHMMFSLCSAGNPFQQITDRILSGLDCFLVYLDDIIIASWSEADHLRPLQILFQQLLEVRLVINQVKCVFGAVVGEFLGHHVSVVGAATITSNIEAIQRHPKPTLIKELQGFLGQYLTCRFIPAPPNNLHAWTGLLT